MTMFELMTSDQPYVSRHTDMPRHLQTKAKDLCFEYNQTPPSASERRAEILQDLFGTCHPMTFIEPSFKCDYGFNIHTHGLLFMNYNCVILDTSPVNIGAGTFIAPGVCLACSGHAYLGEQRAVGIGYSKPITIEDEVWIGANATVCGGVTIGKSSIIGAGSVVNRDIPAGVIAAGNPCRVIRELTEADRIEPVNLEMNE